MIILKSYTTDAPKLSNDLDFCLEFDENGKRYTRLYDKRGDFPIVNCSYLSSKFRNPLHMLFLIHS